MMMGQMFSSVVAKAKGANRVGEPEYRHIIGRIFNFIVKLTAVSEFEDTQCGFKMFSREAAEDLFSVQQMNGIGFDVELIFIALRRGYKVIDVPITWYYDDDSRMRLFQDSLHILLEIWEIRQNWRKGVYERQTTAAGTGLQVLCVNANITNRGIAIYFGIG